MRGRRSASSAAGDRHTRRRAATPAAGQAASRQRTHVLPLSSTRRWHHHRLARRPAHLAKGRRRGGVQRRGAGGRRRARPRAGTRAAGLAALTCVRCIPCPFLSPFTRTRAVQCRCAGTSGPLHHDGGRRADVAMAPCAALTNSAGCSSRNSWAQASSAASSAAGAFAGSRTRSLPRHGAQRRAGGGAAAIWPGDSRTLAQPPHRLWLPHSM